MNANQSLYAVIKATAMKYPDRKALLFMNNALSYSYLLDRIDRTAAGLLKQGIKKGMVVTICMPNIFDCVYLFYACNKIGAICHMVHPLTPAKQMEGFLTSTDSHFLFIIDTFYHNYEVLMKDPTLNIVLCSPVDEFSFVKKIGYRLLNQKRLKNIHHGEQLLRFDSIINNTEQEKKEDPLRPKETAIYLHSGGTSGKPKTIELSAFAVNSLASKTEFILDETDFSNKTMLAVLPMFHGFGLCMGVHALLCFGGCDALMPKFNALETIDLLKKNHVNYIIGVPSLFENLLSKPEFAGPHLKNLRQSYVGGDYVSPSLKNRYDELMIKWDSQSRLLEGYGLTEVVTVCAVNTLLDYKPDSVGRPLPGLKCKIVGLESRTEQPTGELGEIAVSGPTMMNGYLHDPVATAKTITHGPEGDSWVLTGDYGFLDPEGHLHFKQRLKRIVKVSGIPIMPSEIETLVTAVMGVAEAAAIGVDDVDKGHMIKLFIRMKEPNARLDELELKKKIKEELSIYAVPKAIEYVADLPHTIIGKIDTLALEAREKIGK